MAAFGLSQAAFASVFAIVAIQVLNGWVQGMGWPPCGKTMVHWFSTRERGLTVSVWNIAHNIGGLSVAGFAVLGMLLFHDWRAKFYFNALIAAAVALTAWACICATRPSRAGCRRSRSTRTTIPRAIHRPANVRSVSGKFCSILS